jgi:hypothetical protein
VWTQNSRSEKKIITYTGPLPEKLFRYRTITPSTLNRTIDFEILEEAIFLAGLKDLNDPDEARFLVKFVGSDQDILDYWRSALHSVRQGLSDSEIEIEARALLDKVIKSGYIPPEPVVLHTRHVLDHVLRVACFTTQPGNHSMWANYAKHVDATGKTIDHGGICLEYRCDGSWRNETLHPVEYSDAIPEVNPIERDESKLVKVLYTKSREWRCEEEWRIAYVLQATPPFQDNFAVNSKIKLEGAVASVIFGLNTPSPIIDEIRARVSAAKPGIAFKRVVRNPLTFNRELAELK